MELNLFGETTRDVYDRVSLSFQVLVLRLALTRFLAAYDGRSTSESATPEHGRRWVNTNAFYAHLHALDAGLFSTYCTWAIRKAFESTPTTDYPAMDCHVSCAAQWILHSGQIIFREVLNPFEDKKSTMFGAPQPWTLFSWGRWKQGFRDAEKEENLQQTTRQLAKRSADLMDTLEAVMV